MLEWFMSLPVTLQAFLATLFTWGMTALGAALVFTTKSVNIKFLDSMLGFAGGVMIAASFWSLLSPALEMAEGGPLPSWFPAAAGFLAGGLFLMILDKIMPHLHPDKPVVKQKGFIRKIRREVPCSFWRSPCIISRKVWQWGSPLELSPPICQPPLLLEQLRLPLGSASKTSPKAWLFPCRLDVMGCRE